MKKSDFRFFHRLRVRWAEVDMQRIVFNAHYLMYLDTAIADYWRALALPYESGMLLLEGDMYVKKAILEYQASARYEDQLDIGMRCVRVGTSSMVFDGAVFRGDECLVSGELIYVFANPHTQKSKPVPPKLRGLFEAYESGQPVVQCQVGSWDLLGGATRAVRDEVFVKEQGIAATIVWDDADAHAVHALLTNHLGQAVAAGRLLQHASGVGRIGRMAVPRVLRGANLGRDVLLALVQSSRERGDHEVMLNAQCSAQGFYQRFGFVPRGAVFEEAGIAHIGMVLARDSETH